MRYDTIEKLEARILKLEKRLQDHRNKSVRFYKASLHPMHTKDVIHTPPSRK